jgi:hypothetical protein
MRLRPGVLSANRRRGGAPIVNAHRYWRVRFDTANSPDTTVVLNGLYWYENPYADKVTGTVSASDTAPSHKSAALLDDESFATSGITSTTYWAPSSLPASVQIDLGAGNEKEMGAVELYPGPSSLSGGTKTPATWTVQYSDDGSTWTDAWSDSESDWYTAPSKARIGRMSYNMSYGGVDTAVIPLASQADWLLDPINAFSDASVTPAVNNDPVQQVLNQGNAGGVFSQATLGNRPTFKTGGTNGLPYLEFVKANAQFFEDIALTQPSGFTSVTPYMVAIVCEDAVPASGSHALMGNPATTGGKFGVYFRPNSGAMIHFAKSDFRQGNIGNTPAEVLVMALTSNNSLYIAQNEDDFELNTATGTYVSTALTVAQLFRNTALSGSAYFEGKVYSFGIWHNTSLNTPAANRIRRALLRKMGRI